MSENNLDIVKEDGEIVTFRTLKRISNSGIERCIGRIVMEINDKEEKKVKAGSGFLLNIPQRDIKVFITNNHVLDQDFLDNEDRLYFDIEEKEKKINLKKSRIKYTNKSIDYTIIEIIDDDKISDFLEIDENFNSNDYMKEQIFVSQYPEGKELSYSHGKIIKKDNKFLYYNVGTRGGSSGSPIILFDNLKVIGLHLGCTHNKNDKINIGIPIELILDDINKIIPKKESVNDLLIKIKAFEEEKNLLNKKLLIAEKKFREQNNSKNLLIEEIKTLKNEIKLLNEKCNDFKNDNEELNNINSNLNDEILKLENEKNNMNNKLNEEISKLENYSQKIFLINKIINIDNQNLKYCIPHKYLLIDLIQGGYIFTEKVANIMLEVNRSDFFQSNNPFGNYAQSIGFGTTISAPHMHALALEYLSDYCTEGGNILDIGSGTGFLTVCLSKLSNGTGKVIGVEHIPEIYNMGLWNVKKNHSNLINNGNILFFLGDGRQGWKNFAPYKAIHVGAAVENHPQVLIDQLALNGRMFIPVGKKGQQKICVYDKDSLGNVSFKALFDVSYGILTDKETQLKNQ